MKAVVGSRSGLTLSIVALLAVGQVGMAAPPGSLPYGAYDPEGYYSNDPDLTIEHVFMPWEDVSIESLAEADAYAQERNRALIVTIEPWTWTRDERNTAEFLQQGIKAGYYDANMRALCSAIGDLKSPVSIRWAHEMENSLGQFIWSDWNPQEYISAYRRMIEICREGAPQANMIWSPVGLSNASDYYPGDDYVDLIGLSIFGFEPWDEAMLGGAQDYAELLTERYAEVSGFNKPVVVAEVGYSGHQSYVDAWDAKVRAPRPDLPLLIGAVYFNQQEVHPWPNGFGLPDWRVEHRVLKDDE